MFEKHKLEKAAQEQAAATAAWQHEDDLLRGLRTLVIQGGGPEGGGPAAVPLVLKKGERSVYLFTGGGLFQPVRGPGHYAGASSGFSIPIGSTGVRFRIGQSRGTFVQGQENPTVIDHGAIVMTDQRVAFLGSKRTVEWAFSKLVGIQHYQNRPWTAIQVSNRQNVTGVTYDAEHLENFRLRLEAAVALFQKDTAALLGQLEEAIAAHDALRSPSVAVSAGLGTGTGAAGVPVVAGRAAAAGAPGNSGLDGYREAARGAPPPPPSWYPDPRGRHQYRYWDGVRWTEQVADAGVESIDRL